MTVATHLPPCTSAVPLRAPSAEAVLPGRVAAALGLLGVVRVVESAEWRAVQDQLGDRPPAEEDLAAWVQTELQVLEAVEALKSWADAHGLAALARMHQAVGSQCQLLADTRTWRLSQATRASQDTGRTKAVPTDSGPADAGRTKAVPTDSGPADAGRTEASPIETDPTNVAGPAKAAWMLETRRAKVAEANAAWDVRAETDTSTVDEVMLATGLPEGEVRRRLALALDRHGRGSVLHAGLTLGQTSLYRATTMHQQTAGLDTQVARAVCVRLLTPAPDGSSRSHRWFTQTLHRQVLRHTTDLVATRRDALAARRAYASMDDTGGTATLVATGDATRITAAIDRVDRLARRIRAVGDARTLDQLRSDITIDLILYGWMMPTPTDGTTDGTTDRAADGAAHGAVATRFASGDSTGSPDSTASNSTGSPDSTASDGTGSPDSSASNSSTSARGSSTGSGGDTEGIPGRQGVPGVQGAAELAMFTRFHQDTPLRLGPSTFVGVPPPAQVHVVVSLSTLLGLDDGPGEIPGWGPIDAAHARQAAVTAGSVWRRLVTDPLTGNALELSTGRYRPTQAMADVIAALDGTCRAPGCTIAAATCDLDHHRPWPQGPTTIANLSAKHRRHHNHKTRGTWRCEADLHGTLTWTTTSGRRYTTTRFSYDTPEHHHVTDADIDHASQLGNAAMDPPPF